MILLPFLVGGISGAVIVGALYRIGALRERSGLAVLLAAIAFFWPVFAVQAGASASVIAFHSGVFILFSALASYGFRKSAAVLAFGLIAHGAFDALTMFTGHPGPIWWPAFCATLDIVAGTLVLLMIRMGRILA